MAVVFLGFYSVLMGWFSFLSYWSGHYILGTTFLGGTALLFVLLTNIPG